MSLNWETNISVSSYDRSRRAREAMSFTNFSSTLISVLIRFSLWDQAVGTSMEENNLTDTLLVQHGSQQPCQTESKATMRRAAKPKEVKIKLDGFEADSLFRSLLHQDVITVFALCTGRNFHPFPQQVKTFRQVWFVFLSHMIEGTDRCWIVGDKNELMPVLFFGIFT